MASGTGNPAGAAMRKQRSLYGVDPIAAGRRGPATKANLPASRRKQAHMKGHRWCSSRPVCPAPSRGEANRQDKKRAGKPSRPEGRPRPGRGRLQSQFAYFAKCFLSRCSYLGRKRVGRARASRRKGGARRVPSVMISITAGRRFFLAASRASARSFWVLTV